MQLPATLDVGETRRLGGDQAIAETESVRSFPASRDALVVRADAEAALGRAGEAAANLRPVRGKSVRGYGKLGWRRAGQTSRRS